MFCDLRQIVALDRHTVARKRNKLFFLPSSSWYIESCIKNDKTLFWASSGYYFYRSAMGVMAHYFSTTTERWLFTEFDRFGHRFLDT
mgnify:CR=1 FL=1